MARVRFVGLGLSAEVGADARILDAARACGAPEASRCAGVCACSTCHVYVRAGAEHLSDAADEELDMLDLAAEIREEASRLGCQARVRADAPVDAELAIEISEESFREYLDAATPSERERAVRLWAARK